MAEINIKRSDKKCRIQGSCFKNFAEQGKVAEYIESAVLKCIICSNFYNSDVLRICVVKI